MICKERWDGLGLNSLDKKERIKGKKKRGWGKAGRSDYP